MRRATLVRLLVLPGLYLLGVHDTFSALRFAEAADGTYDVPPFNYSAQGSLSGELAPWHKITLGFDSGIATSELNSTVNPFLNYRLDVNFTHNATARLFIVPGYYAADGNAANTGASSGSVWLCHFTPHQTGAWTWQASFRYGPNVSVAVGAITASLGNAVAFDGASGSFVVSAAAAAATASNRDFRQRGRLEYVGERHLQFAGDGGGDSQMSDYFFKSGVASPENIFNYVDFDASVTSSLTSNESTASAVTTAIAPKSWLPHERDYRTGNPTWAGGKGTGLIGALNYLSDIGLNAISIQTMTLLGDDGAVSPFVAFESGDSSPDRLLRYDVSKLAQWQVVLDHANNVGLHVQVVTQEQENDQLFDGGGLGPERIMYYRELVARFGHHLALTWNLGEDNTNDDAQRKSFSECFSAHDPYQHPVVIHSFSIGKNATYGPLLNYPPIAGVSLQSRPEAAFDDALEWVQASTDAGRNWIVCNDEQNPNSIGVLPDVEDADNHRLIRQNFLWAIIMAGGAGIEYYFGSSSAESDLTCQDFRSREGMFNQSRHALDFIQSLPTSIHMLSNANSLVGQGNWALTDASGSTFIVYARNGGATTIDLTRSLGSSYRLSWFDPRSGNNTRNDNALPLIAGKQNASIGEPPYDASMDWVALLECDDCVDSVQSVVPSAMPSASPMMAPFVSFSPGPVTLAPAAATDEVAAPVSTLSPTSATPVMAPFVSLTPFPVASSTSPIAAVSENETPALAVSSASPTSATPMMAPFIPLTTSPAVPTSVIVFDQRPNQNIPQWKLTAFTPTSLALASTLPTMPSTKATTNATNTTVLSILPLVSSRDENSNHTQTNINGSTTSSVQHPPPPVASTGRAESSATNPPSAPVASNAAAVASPSFALLWNKWVAPSSNPQQQPSLPSSTAPSPPSSSTPRQLRKTRRRYRGR